MATTNPSRISELSTTIQSNVQIIDSYYTAQGLPSPSFDVDFPADLPQDVQQARQAVQVATDELSDLMLGAHHIAECLPPQHTSLVGHHAISRWSIADHLGEIEEATFETLANRCGVPEGDFTRILRQAMSRHLFKEPRKGVVAHTAASKLFIGSTALKDYMSVALDDMWPSATRIVDAMEKWNYSSDANKCGFNVFENTDKSYFESMKTNSKRKKAFANLMSYMHSRPGFGSSHAHLLSSFDWNSVQKIVDMGGGLGDACIGIIRDTSVPHCIVQDLPDVVAQANQEDVGADLGGRLTFMAHNFFDQQPVEDADVYFLRWTLHDWSDPDATKILRNLAPALKPGAQVIIQEFVIPPPGAVPFLYEKSIRCMDLGMKATFNSKEREIDDWVQLFANADSRFKFVDAKMGEGTGLAVLRFSWEGTESASNGT